MNKRMSRKKPALHSIISAFTRVFYPLWVGTDFSDKDMRN
jgi:hypothetical protein